VRPPCGVRRPDPTQLAELIPAFLHPFIAHQLAQGSDQSSDLTSLLGRRLDQGHSSSCSCHAAASGLYAASRGSFPWFPSPGLLYRASGRIEAPSGNPIRDDGRQLCSVLRAIRETGIGPMRAPTPDGRWSDIWTPSEGEGSLISSDLTAIERAACASYDAGNHTIDPSSDGACSQIIAALTSPAPAPVLVATEVGEAFDGLAGDAVAQPDSATDPKGGGHALLIVGHRPLAGAPGRWQFRLANSWGESWDDNGECWASEAWVRACWELHPLICLPVEEPCLGLVERLRAALRRMVPWT
jgi:hypothetical protein